MSERGTGSAFFASVLMIIGGAMALLMGVAGIVRDTFYVILANCSITYSSATQGWVLVGYGVVLPAAGIARSAVTSYSAVCPPGRCRTSPVARRSRSPHVAPDGSSRPRRGRAVPSAVVVPGLPSGSATTG